MDSPKVTQLVLGDLMVWEPCLSMTSFVSNSKHVHSREWGSMRRAD